MTQDRNNELVTLLNKWAREYYIEDKPSVSDAVYDQHYMELRELERKHPEFVRRDSPTQSIVGNVLSGLEPLEHKVPMLSLFTETNTDNSAVEKFHNRIKSLIGDEDFFYVVEPKYDGLAISLRYENGKLVSAGTRGDGLVGENVTHNVLTIKDIPKDLSFFIPELSVLEIRGEIHMTRDSFNLLNERQERLGAKLFSNPRNAAAGSIRQLDPKVTAMRGLSFTPYGLGEVKGNLGVTSQSELLEKFRQWGFFIPKIYKVNDAEGLVKVYEKYLNNRDLGFEIDGIVYKVDSFDLQKRLGFRSKEPVWAVAHKFPPNEKVTKLLNIDLQVGRTGKITPVARLEPIVIDGSVVSNATLSNVFDIRKKDVRIGDEVIVRKAGEIIPEIVGRIITTRNGYVKNFRMTQGCPVCGSKLIREKGEANYKCYAGTQCMAQRKEAFNHFVSRNAMNIDGLGPKIIEALVNNGLKSFSDIYRLTVYDFLKIPRLGYRVATKLLQSIEGSKVTTLPRLLYGLGIPHVGESTSKDLAKHFSSLENITAASYEELLAIPDIGPKVANSIFVYFKKESNLLILKDLMDLGIGFKKEPVLDKQPLVGITFAITGSFENINRSAIKELIETNGGKFSSDVSLRTNYLIAGEGGGSKLSHAQKLNIKVIDLETFNKLLEN